MGTIQRERETEKREMLPLIRRQVYNSITSLGRIASHVRTPVEGAYATPQQADFAMRISSNMASLRLDAVPLSSRFARMLEDL
jgi:hypothetical protein